MPSLIAIFGGTFDPPHLGHLALTAAARHQLGLDRLLWVPTPDPPHKQGQPITPLEHRLAMVKLALDGHTEFELSTVEIDRPGPHFSLDTVRILARQNPGSELVYLMGGDSLHDLPTWHHPAELVSALGYLGVMRRPGDEIDLPALDALIPGLLDKVRFVDAPPMEISGSKIRSLAAAGHSFRRFVPARVYTYICAHQLYR